MKKRRWKTRIKKLCMEIGTYKKSFDDLIDMAAAYAEQRDNVGESLLEEELIIEQTNKGGFTNKVKNPAYVIWDDLNKTLLMCWRELGLTPAQLKKINEDTFIRDKEEKNGNNLIELLRKKQQTEKGIDDG